MKNNNNRVTTTTTIVSKKQDVDDDAHHKKKSTLWTNDQDAAILVKRTTLRKSWRTISLEIPGRSEGACRTRYSLLMKNNNNRVTTTTTIIDTKESFLLPSIPTETKVAFRKTEAQKLKESVRVNSICVSCQCLSLYFCYNLTFIC